MKLELARAMLYKADLLLLDEVGFPWIYQPTCSDCIIFSSPPIIWTKLPSSGSRIGFCRKRQSLASSSVTTLGKSFILSAPFYDIISHRIFSFLDNVTTDVIHYEQKKVIFMCPSHQHSAAELSDDSLCTTPEISRALWPRSPRPSLITPCRQQVSNSLSLLQAP